MGDVMKLAEWTTKHLDLIKRASMLEELGFSVSLNPSHEYVEFIIRKRT